MLVLEAAGGVALLLLLLWLRFYLTAPPPMSGFKTLEQSVEAWQRNPRRARGRSRRRGGYIKPPASLSRSPATASTTGVTLILAGGSSSSPPPGAASTVTVIRPTPPRGSSGTELGWSTAGTEDLGASGLQLVGAALTSPVGELAVTGSALSGVNDGRGDDRHDRLPVPGDLSSFVWPDGITRFYQEGAA